MFVKIDDKYDSSALLFSIPVHENQEIINNQIENILNFNPGAKIILHINKSFINFNIDKTKYNNVFINPTRYNYSYAKGLLWIHIQNFLEAIKINIEFKYFIIGSSNEMFIKNGLISYIEQFKNGLQIVKFDRNIDWYNFQKNIEKDQNIISLLNDINLDTIYGGQPEGQFYEKNYFQKISDITLKYFDKELNNFKTEEIVTQTIFKSFNISYGLPFTLQNYSNNITFTPKIIDYIINNNIKIDNNRIKKNLVSPHINNDCTSIYSIKRIDDNVRNYLSRKGFVLNKDIFQLNTYYYSNTSRLILYNNDHLYFKKNIGEKSFNWFGYELDEGYYNLNFNIKSLNKIINFEKIGLKIHFPHEILYNFFFENLDINIWKSVMIPLHITQKQHIIFIFDNYSDFINIELKNIQILNIAQNIKNNIGVVLYENFDNNNNDYSINYSNINNMILEPFSKIYNIYKFITILNIKNTNQIINNYKPNTILFNDENKSNINDIFIKSTENIYNFKEKCKINFKFIIYLRLDSIFKKTITNFNFYINKFNFLSYYIPYIDNKISNSYDFISMPYKYIDNFYNLIKNNEDNKNICYSIYSKLKNEINEINFICDDNFAKDVRTPLIKYLSDITDIHNNNNGYLFNKKYLYNIAYKNSLSTLYKNNNNEFYFYKKPSIKSVDYQWIGLYIDNFINNTNEAIYITISFDIKLLAKINNKELNFGIKTSEPILFYNNWINDCEINIYKKIEINIKISKKNQYIMLNFDNYLEEVKLYIKNFKIIMEY